jgi:hypothetical protein
LGVLFWTMISPVTLMACSNWRITFCRARFPFR